MIVLTTGQASITRLMRADAAPRSQNLASRQMDGHQDQGDQSQASTQRQGRVRPARPPWPAC
jgi:hypothetical protein